MTEKTGFLTKEGGSIKTWKRRYFVLKNGELAYFKDKKDASKEPTGVIQLSTATAVQLGERKKHPNCFEIVNPGRVYAFSADNEEERSSWVTALSKEKAAHEDKTKKS